MLNDLVIQMDQFLPLRDVVFDVLRQNILTGELKPGERLMEIHLANKLGVSRTPIREAIRKLELEGLVTMIPRRGAEVAEITEESLHEVLEVRRALDVFCVELSCERITDEEKILLEKAMIAFEEVAKEKNIKEIAKADVIFHEVIMNATRNNRLIQLIQNLSEQVYRYRFEYIKDESGHDTLIEEHRLIYQSIIENNTEEAVRVVTMHINNQERAIIQHIREEKLKKGIK